MSDSLRDQVAAAYDSSVAVDESIEEVVSESPAQDVEESEIEIKEPSEPSSQDDIEVEDVPAPEHWAAEDKEVFKSLDKRGKDFLIRRHKDMEAGYTKKQQALAEAAKVAETYNNMMRPHQDYLKQRNVSPEVAFEKLMAAERVLMNGTQEEKALIMQKLARDYKVDLSIEVDPIQQHNQIVLQKLQELEQRQQQLDRMKEQEVTASYQHQIVSFAQSKDEQGNLKYPHFEKIKKDMGLVLQAGKAQTLEEAYELSILMDAGLRKEYLAKQNRLEDSAKKAVASKKAGFNVRSGTGGQISDPRKELSLRATIAQAVDAQLRG
jgi:hypothetical protein